MNKDEWIKEFERARRYIKFVGHTSSCPSAYERKIEMTSDSPVNGYWYAFWMESMGMLNGV